METIWNTPSPRGFAARPDCGIAARACRTMENATIRDYRTTIACGPVGWPRPELVALVTETTGPWLSHATAVAQTIAPRVVAPRVVTTACIGGCEHYGDHVHA